MTRERFMWYKQEIEILQKIDKQITDRVRASYEIPNKLAKSLKEVQKETEWFPTRTERNWIKGI